MVASPNVALGGLPGALAGRFNQQQRVIDEQGRASHFPMSVSSNGIPVVTATTNPAGTTSVATVFDGAGNPMVMTDPDCGYGLAFPHLAITGYSLDPSIIPSTTSSSFTATWAGIWNATNPGFLGSVNLKLTGGTACEIRWHLYRYDNSGFSVVSSVAAFGAGGFIDQYRGFLLDETHIGHDMVVEVQARVSAGSGTVYAQPIAATGISAAIVRSNDTW